MRPLDEKETTAVFDKMMKFSGVNLAHIVNRSGGEAGRYVFRLHKNRVYYVSDSLVRRATNVSRERLASLGIIVGKFTKGGSFRLTIQCLDLLTAHASNKVWLKPAAEMSFLYGNSVLKGGLARITENTKSGDGVVVFSMSDVPLGFGVAARGTQECRKAIADAIVVNHQADLGEYLRNEDDL
ncbi:60S ribosome subunit biogenesis protein NIP7 [Iris pallida]|uniref:60S ribosome subunit biogenesis protein NIP7 homolog n=1 Tax=Iris pallida TaxID=29817 RepID=A0AAX6F2P7_IRIPA|nr:60S ribosome subunit biogenesis protein NIP7 [Iris pallida]